MSKTKSIISFLIALISAICAVVLFGITSHAAAYEDIIEASITIICRSEGDYSTVFRNDNGALSVGKIQWHADHALALMKSIVSEDEVTAKELVGEELFNEITTSTSWSQRIVSVSEAEKLSNLLDSPQGRKVQDEWAFNFVSEYAQHAYRYGIVDPYAIVFLCDVENKGGESATYRYMTRAKAMAGSYAGITVDDLYDVAIEFGVTGPGTRRTKLYNYCKSIDFGPTEITGREKWTVVSDNLNIRSEPDASSAKMGAFKKGDTFYITERFEGKVGDKDRIWGKTDKGWVCIYYGNYISGSLDYSSLDNRPSGDGEAWCVNTDTLRIRSGPGIEYDQVGRYERGAYIIVTEKYQGTDYIWGKTDKGWVALKYADYVSGSITERVDTVGPNISDSEIIKITGRSFTVSCYIFDVSGVKDAFAEVTYTASGQTVKYPLKGERNTYTVEVPYTAFGGQAGEFTVKITAVDTVGNEATPKTVSAEITAVLGDVDGNGKIELRDAMTVIDFVSKKIDNIDETLADVTGDKKITLAGGMRIIDYVSKRTASL